jgi:peptidase E
MADEKVTYDKNSPLFKQTQLPPLTVVPHQTYGLKTTVSSYKIRN